MISQLDADWYFYYVRWDIKVHIRTFIWIKSTTPVNIYFQIFDVKGQGH